MKNENMINKLLSKCLGYLLLLVTFSVYTHKSIRKPLPFHPQSLKGKAHRINKYLWGIVFFCFSIDTYLSCVDDFILSKPLTIKYLTIVALSLIILITLIDFFISFIKNNDKAPSH